MADLTYAINLDEDEITLLIQLLNERLSNWSASILVAHTLLCVPQPPYFRNFFLFGGMC
jgi:hypothetical protein